MTYTKSMGENAMNPFGDWNVLEYCVERKDQNDKGTRTWTMKSVNGRNAPDKEITEDQAFFIMSSEWMLGAKMEKNYAGYANPY